MAPIAFVLALFLQGQPAAEAAAAPPPPAEADAAAAPEGPAFPSGAPRDDYQFVAWCYGSLRGYLDLHDKVMPEVTRIESTYRPPDRKLSDDLAVYADMQKAGKAQLKDFQSAMIAAEKASLRPINTQGAAAVAKGHDIWRITPDVTPARLAQEWMSWALPARCETTARDLKAKATLMGGAFRTNETTDTPPAESQTSPAPPSSDPAAPLLEAPKPDIPPAPPNPGR